MDKPALIHKIKSLDGLAQDEKAALIDLLNQTKKYGLVWEDKPEAVEEQLRTQLPVLIEVPERRILAEQLTKQTPAASPGKATPTPSPDLFSTTEPQTTEPQIPNTSPPNHILIEGDNLHALTALTFTHEGRIDVIYIDPPYNTGNKDFKYNDSFVDKEDSYRHSKWLSFMHKRLQIAKKLLSEKGVIFISIDDNEQAQLKLLCDEVFYEENYLGDCVWKRRASSGLSNYKFSKDHEYVKVYKKPYFTEFKGINKTYEKYSNPDNDPRGEWIADNLTVGMGKDQRPNQFYVLINPETGVEYQPNPNRVWSHIPESMDKLIKEKRIIFPKSNNQRPLIKRFRNELKITDNPISSLINNSFEIGLNSEGTRVLQDFGLDGNFVYPKPVTLAKSLISFVKDDDIVILDFFAGSGTTLHATMQLNSEDGGNRQCIMVTNNENNICEEVTYERNKRVIQGYTNSKGNWVDGLINNNLRYYKTDFVGSARTEQNRRKLTRLSTALLQIKEDSYTDITAQYGFDIEHCHISTNEQGRHLIVLYHSRKQAEVIEQLRAFIRSLPPTNEKIKLYAFGEEKEILLDAFYDVAARMEAVPLPDAIYNAYRATFRSLKLERKAPVNIAAEAESDSETTDNETNPTED